MAVSGFGCRKELVGAGRDISVLFGINGTRNNQSHLVGPPFSAFKPILQLPFRTETRVHLTVLASENALEKKTWTLKS